MRILILTNHYPPSAVGSYEIQCLQATHGLISRGHQVHVLCGQSQAGKPSPELGRIVERKLAFYPDDTAPASRFMSLFRIVRANIEALRRTIRKFHPEAILVWGMKGLPHSLLMEAERSAVPCVYVIYDHWLGNAPGKDPWYSYWNEDDADRPALLRNFLRRLRLDKSVYSRAPFGDVRDISFEHVCFCSNTLREETARNIGRDFSHTKVIPCSIIPSEIKSRSGQPAAPRRLLYAARLSEEKDPFTALKAVLELRRRGYEEFTLDLIGRGDVNYESSLHDYVRRYQLGGSVSFKPMNDELIRNNIHLYDFLIFTSKYPEPFPLIHLKAMAAKVPVISTLEGGTSELIRDGENGIAFRTSDPKDLTDKILHLADDRDLRERIADAAYTEAVGKYSLKQIVPRFESLLNEAVSRGKGVRVVV